MKRFIPVFLISPFLYLVMLGVEPVDLQREIKRDYSSINKMLRIQPPPGSVELEIACSFPTEEQEEQDQYFWNPYGIASDPVGNIFVIEFSNMVFKYDSAGKFIKKFGRTGQGPGELSRPLQIRSLKDSIVIAEDGNRRLQYFDFEGNFRKIVKLFRWYFSFDINEEGLIFGVPLIRQNNESQLIEVLSAEGKLINSFGSLLDYKHDHDYLNRAFLFLNKKGEVLVVFMYFPIVRRYSQKGSLIAEHYIKTEMMEEKEKHNKKLYSYRPQERVAYIQAVHCAKIHGDHLFILDYVPPRIYIMEMNEAGQLENTYWAKVVDKYLAFSLLPDKENDRMKFYVLQKNPEARINIFLPKN
jgi:hypothetical protein